MNANAPLYTNESRIMNNTCRENGKCKVCKKVFSRLTLTITRATTTYGITGTKTRYTELFRGNVDGVTRHADPFCCGRQVSMLRVKGVRNANIPCDARCTNAKGHNCECSCGGKNHGAGHNF